MWIRNKINQIKFKTRWGNVVEVDTNLSLDRLIVMHPLTGERFKVLRVIRNVDLWYILEDQYVLNCNSNTGYPMIDTVYYPDERFFKSINNCWVGSYLIDKAELDHGREK
jgi:hypothetical protein